MNRESIIIVALALFVVAWGFFGLYGIWAFGVNHLGWG